MFKHLNRIIETILSLADYSIVAVLLFAETIEKIS
jgi:hypothetical protein